jgi:hypothetical protein
MGISVNNPFGFPQNCGAGPAWAQGQIGNQGATSTDHDIEAGCNNTADNWGTPNSPYSNSGSDQTSNDICGDPTVVNTAVQFNAIFVADNIFTGQGSIGLYGRSRGAGTKPSTIPPPTPAFACPTAGNPPVQSPLNDWSIGVLGQSSKGCGVFGLATNDNPVTGQPSDGIGVVGRCAGGEALEETSVEQLMGEHPDTRAAANDPAIGVLGQSLNGPGVRGHGGPLTLFAVPVPGTSPILPAPAKSVQAGPGGVFSSGQRIILSVGGNALLAQEVSHDTCAQLRLVPSIGPKLPAIAQIGDMFLQLGSIGNSLGAQLWICTGFGGPSFTSPTAPAWQPVSMGSAVQGTRI